MSDGGGRRRQAVAAGTGVGVGAVVNVVTGMLTQQWDLAWLAAAGAFVVVGGVLLGWLAYRATPEPEPARPTRVSASGPGSIGAGGSVIGATTTVTQPDAGQPTPAPPDVGDGVSASGPGSIAAGGDVKDSNTKVGTTRRHHDARPGRPGSRRGGPGTGSRTRPGTGRTGTRPGTGRTGTRPGTGRTGTGTAGVDASGAGTIAAVRDVIGSSTHVYQAVPLPRADEVDPPPGVSSALPARTARFVGRGGKLAELDAAAVGAAVGGAVGGAVVQAVHGLGGVGRSTLAAQWAHQHATDHTLTWWITADSEENVTAGLAEHAGMLAPEMTRATPAAVPLEERAAWARRWLATHNGWPAVLDNVTRPDDVAALVNGAPGGRFLITSRLRGGWHELVPAVIELDVLSPSEAQELLAGIVTAGRTTADLTGAAEPCAELGYLPLAVTQASAYTRQTRLSPDDYLRLLRADPATMYEEGEAAPTGSAPSPGSGASP